MTVVTPHELFMGLEPSLFPWESRVTTDFNELLPILNAAALSPDKQKEVLEQALANPDETQLALVYDLRNMTYCS